jgi:hypothetical protein
MAPRQTLPSVQAASSEQDYKAVSGVAVAAIVVAGGFVLIATVTGIAAIFFKRPLMDWYLVFLAGLGVALSAAASMHVRRAEGTRTGQRLAATAWWLSVVGGVAFAAYYYANVFAVRQQAERAAADWFDLLKKRDVDGAFLFTLPVQQRQNLDALDVRQLEVRFGAGPLPAFRNSELVRFFKRNGNDVTVESVGMSNLEPFEGGYRMELTYLIKGPEGVFERRLHLIGLRSEKGASREWQIGSDGSLTPKGLTPYGFAVRELEARAGEQARLWMGAAQSKLAETALFATLPVAERPAFVALWLETHAGDPFAFVQIGAPLPPYLSGTIRDGKIEPIRTIRDGKIEPLSGGTFDLLAQKGFFKLEAGAAGAGSDRQKLLREVWNLGQLQPLLPATRLQNPETAPTISITDDRIEYTQPINVVLPTSPPRYAGARIVLVCDAPEVVRRVAELKAAAKANPQYFDRPPEDLLPWALLGNWRVVRLETSLEPLEAPQRPNG